nr:MAG TPA: hypothetical protein [Bacteriophage sp.]
MHIKPTQPGGPPPGFSYCQHPGMCQTSNPFGLLVLSTCPRC